MSCPIDPGPLVVLVTTPRIPGVARVVRRPATGSDPLLTEDERWLLALSDERNRYRDALERIQANCLRGAHKLGMTVDGVQAIADIARIALEQEGGE